MSTYELTYLLTLSIFSRPAYFSEPIHSFGWPTDWKFLKLLQNNVLQEADKVPILMPSQQVKTLKLYKTQLKG